MKKAILYATFFLIVILPATARNRIVVFDLVVQTESPEYEHIGKGFSELLHFELEKSSGISMLRRKKQLDYLEEMNLSLLDLDDSRVRNLACKFLKVDFLVFGHIRETPNGIALHLLMADGRSGEVVWSEELNEQLSYSEYISASLARSLLTYLDAKVGKITIAKAIAKRSMDAGAMIDFSEAVAYLDENDMELAQKALIGALKKDPRNEAIQTYMQRFEWSFELVSQKYRAESKLFNPTYNPAVLGFIEQDRLFASASIGFSPSSDGSSTQTVDGYDITETIQTQRYGYMIPLGKKLGLGAEVMSDGYDKVVDTLLFTFDYQGLPQNRIPGSPRCLGGTVGLGYSFLENMSVGTSFAVWNSNRAFSDNYMTDAGVDFAVVIGYMLKTIDNRMSFLFTASYADFDERFVDFSVREVKEGAVPLVLEASLSKAMADFSLIASVTGISDIYIDGRGGYKLRVLPVMEYQAFPFLAVRVGGEYSNLDQFDEFAFGYGGIAGFTATFWRIDLSGNLCIRKKPTDTVPGKSISDWTLLFDLTFTPGFMRREGVVMQRTRSKLR